MAVVAALDADAPDALPFSLLPALATLPHVQRNAQIYAIMKAAGAKQSHCRKVIALARLLKMRSEHNT